MASLYEINQEISSCIDEETGEVVNFEKLANLQIEFDSKIENMALWYKNLISDAEAFKKEKDYFTDKEKSAKNKADSIKEYIRQSLNGNKFSTTKVNISYRKSEAVECEDLSKVEDDYLKYAEPSLKHSNYIK